MKNPPWLSAAGCFSARDNAQTILGSQWKSTALFVLQIIQSSGILPLLFSMSSNCSEIIWQVHLMLRLVLAPI